MSSVFFMGKYFESASSSLTNVQKVPQLGKMQDSSHFPLKMPSVEELQGLASYLLVESPSAEAHALAKACSVRLFVRNRSFASPRHAEKFLEVLRSLRGLVLSSVYMEVLHSLMFFSIKEARALVKLTRNSDRLRTEVLSAQCMGVVTLFVLYWMVIQKKKNRKVTWRSVTFWTEYDVTTFDTLLATYGLLSLEQHANSPKSLAWWACIMKMAERSNTLTTLDFMQYFPVVAAELFAQFKIGDKPFVPKHTEATLGILAHEWTWDALISKVRVELLEPHSVKLFKQKLKTLTVGASRQEEVSVGCVNIPALVRVLIHEQRMSNSGKTGVVADCYSSHWAELPFTQKLDDAEFSYTCLQESFDLVDYLMNNLEKVSLDNTARYLLPVIIQNKSDTVRRLQKSGDFGKAAQTSVSDTQLSRRTMSILKEYTLELRACYASSSSLDVRAILDKYLAEFRSYENMRFLY